MTTLYDQPIFNYPLPDEFYSSGSSRLQPRSGYHHGDNISRSMFIDPQQLTMLTPIPPPLDEYSFSAVPFSTSPRTYNYLKDPASYVSSSHRKRPGSSSMYSGSGHKTYAIRERSPGHRSSRPSYSSQSGLLSPPLSPSGSVPGSSSRGPRQSVHITTTSTAASTRFYCTHPNCIDSETGESTKSFSRRADLQRHHACAHETQQLLSCPKHNCSRKGANGFNRQDHLIEHRRGYHGEDIPKRGSRGHGHGHSEKKR